MEGKKQKGKERTFLEILVDSNKGLFEGIFVFALLEAILGDENIVQVAAGILCDGRAYRLFEWDFKDCRTVS